VGVKASAAELEAQLAALREENAGLKRRLRHLGRLSELGRHLAGVAHEMNQPLLGVKAIAQLVGREASDEVVQRRLAFIEEQAVVLESLVRRLRLLSRGEDGEDEAQPVALREVLDASRGVLQHRQRKVGAELEVRFELEAPTFIFGLVHAQQVLVNLLSNAFDAVASCSARRVWVIARAGAPGRLEIVVADSGVGMPGEVRERLFDPFFTTKTAEQGTGLGMSISREIVQAYGGTITALTGAEAEAAAGERVSTALRLDLVRAGEGSP